MATIILKEDNLEVGFVDVRAEENRCELVACWVAEAQRRKGHGAVLLSLAIAYARKHSCEVLCTHPSAAKRTAPHLYELAWDPGGQDPTSWYCQHGFRTVQECADRLAGVDGEENVYGQYPYLYWLT